MYTMCHHKSMAGNCNNTPTMLSMLECYKFGTQHCIAKRYQRRTG